MTVPKLRFTLERHPLRDGFTHAIFLYPTADYGSKLLAEVRGARYATLMAAAPALLAALRNVEWEGAAYSPGQGLPREASCPSCRGLGVHGGACELAAALKAAEPAP